MEVNGGLHVVEPRPFVPYVWERQKSVFKQQQQQQQHHQHFREPESAEAELHRHQIERQRTIPVCFDRDNTVLHSPRDEKCISKTRLLFIRHREPSNLITPVNEFKKRKRKTSARPLELDGTQLPLVDFRANEQKQVASAFHQKFWNDEAGEESFKTGKSADVIERVSDRRRKKLMSLPANWGKENPYMPRLNLPKVNLSHTETSTVSKSQPLARTILKFEVRGNASQTGPTRSIHSNDAAMLLSSTQKYLNTMSLKSQTRGEILLNRGRKANSRFEQPTPENIMKARIELESDTDGLSGDALLSTRKQSVPI